MEEQPVEGEGFAIGSTAARDHYFVEHLLARSPAAGSGDRPGRPRSMR